MKKKPRIHKSETEYIEQLERQLSELQMRLHVTYNRMWDIHRKILRRLNKPKKP